MTKITSNESKIMTEAGHFVQIPGGYKIRLTLMGDERDAFYDQYVELKQSSQELNAIFRKSVTV